MGRWKVKRCAPNLARNSWQECSGPNRLGGCIADVTESRSTNGVPVAQGKPNTEAVSAPAHPDPNAIKPRIVYAEACAVIADHLKGDRFKYLKNGPKLKRIEGDLTQEIWFGSSHFNVTAKVET